MTSIDRDTIANLGILAPRQEPALPFDELGLLEMSAELARMGSVDEKPCDLCTADRRCLVHRDG